MNPELLKVTGRVLAKPPLILGGNQTLNVPITTQWNLPGKRFVRPKPIPAWAVIVYEPRNERNTRNIAENFVKDLLKRLAGLGTP